MILSKDKMKRYCNDQWPNYKVDDGEWWPEYGLLQFHTIQQLMLLCHRLGKRHEVPCIDALVTLYRNPSTWKKCKLGGGMLMPCIEGKGENKKARICMLCRG